MTKGIFKDTVLESGVTSQFIKARDVKIDIATKSMIFTLEYYLDEPSLENGLQPVTVKEYFLDSGFVLQFSQANNLNLEVVMYNLLNTVIGGIVDVN